MKHDVTETDLIAVSTRGQIHHRTTSYSWLHVVCENIRL